MAIVKPRWFSFDCKMKARFGKVGVGFISLWLNPWHDGRWGIALLPVAFSEALESVALIAIYKTPQEIPLTTNPYYLHFSFLWIFNKTITLGSREYE